MCLILIVCVVLKGRGVVWFVWAVRNVKRNAMKPLHTMSTLTFCFFYFQISSLYIKSKILFRPFRHKSYFMHKSFLTSRLTSRHNLTSIAFQNPGIPNAFLLVIMKFPSFSLLSWLSPLGSRKERLFTNLFTQTSILPVLLTSGKHNWHLFHFPMITGGDERTLAALRLCFSRWFVFGFTASRGLRATLGWLEWGTGSAGRKQGRDEKEWRETFLRREGSWLEGKQEEKILTDVDIRPRIHLPHILSQQWP